MKKLLVAMLSSVMVMSLAACGGTEEVSDESLVQVEAEAVVEEKPKRGRKPKKSEDEE